MKLWPSIIPLTCYAAVYMKRQQISLKLYPIKLSAWLEKLLNSFQSCWEATNIWNRHILIPSMFAFYVTFWFRLPPSNMTLTIMPKHDVETWEGLACPSNHVQFMVFVRIKFSTWDWSSGLPLNLRCDLTGKASEGNESTGGRNISIYRIWHGIYSSALYNTQLAIGITHGTKRPLFILFYFILFYFILFFTRARGGTRTELLPKTMGWPSSPPILNPPVKILFH